jgi:hypothetical protein
MLAGKGNKGRMGERGYALGREGVQGNVLAFSSDRRRRQEVL